MPKQISTLHLRGKALEEMFFHVADRVLIEKKRQLEKTERSLATAAKVSGISSEAILRKLIEMNVQLDVLATLSVIPLIAVAWADGKIEKEERDAVLKGAESFGILKSELGLRLARTVAGPSAARGVAGILDVLHPRFVPFAQQSRA